MVITTVGCSPANPSPKEATTCNLIASESTNLVVDCGHGAVAALLACADIGAISAMIVTHFHPDHFMDLFAYRNVVRKLPAHPRQALWLPPDGKVLLQRVTSGCGLSPDYFEKVFDIGELSVGSNFYIGDIQVDSVLTRHPISTVGLKLTNRGRSIGITSDTGWSNHLIDFFRSVDVLVAECTYLEYPDELAAAGHLSASDVAKLAVSAEVSALVITHYEEKLGGSIKDVIESQGDSQQIKLGMEDRVSVV